MKKMMMASLLTGAVLLFGWFSYANPEIFNRTEDAPGNEAEISAAPRPEASADLNKEEKEILKEFLQLYQGFGDGSIFIEGAVSLHDPMDSAQVKTPVPFSYHQQGGMIFYRSGEQQIVNTPDHYAVADKELKRIVVGAPKSAVPLPIFPPDNMSRILKEEGYRITKEVEGENATIRLLSENHITCKEIVVQFHQPSKKALSFFYRLTDLDHPLDIAYDKTIDVTIHHWIREKEKVAEIPVPRLVEFRNDTVRPAKDLDGFEIINLINQ